MDTSSDQLLPSPTQQNGLLPKVETPKDDQEESIFSSALEPVVVVCEDVDDEEEAPAEKNSISEHGEEKLTLGDDCTVISMPEPSKHRLVSSSSPRQSREDVVTHNFGFSADTENSSTVVPARNDGCCNSVKWYQNRVFEVTSSKYMLAFYFGFLAIPATVGMIAARYMKECPMNPSIPLLVFMTGFAGALCVIFRIVDLFQQWFTPGRADWGYSTVACFVGFFMAFLLLVSEMMLLMQTEPSFNEKSKDYCHPIFYGFTYWMNWVGIGILAAVIILHGPSLIRVDSL